ncbi:MAG: ABC transporter substrate-binding protein [Pseudomonadota bacterium]|nr:ABC transporter substrate-binding protein [Pseudomonadota bacterium]MDP1904142.1 ABC transporter substrate-binding protein [Pseudomonadota bacterium]MDP2353769.1 ABC transporter substrate-binding protein [Pseudomonadota bacterium]
MPHFLLLTLLFLAACSQPVNSPYSAAEGGKKASASVVYSAFGERPKHLDPARSYSENEYVFLGNIYEPPLQYHYLKRPYQLEPQTAAAMPTVRYLDAQGRELPADVAAAKIAVSEYEIRIKPGIRYQPHPAFARDAAGKPRYVPIKPEELAGIARFEDFPETGTRELIAADYVYQVRRLAHPRVQSPILGLMADYIVGLKDLAKALGKASKELPKDAYLDIVKYDFPGAYVVDRYTYRIRIKGKYPQFVYWLGMPFFAPVPEEAERFYRQPGMAERNFTLDWQPVGTGAYYLAENDPNRVMRLQKNPHYHDDFYPTEGDPGDREAGLLDDAGKRLPMVDTVIYSLEKEDVPYWNKFLQGYYDASGVSSDSFDQAIRMNAKGEPDLTDDMRSRGILLATAARPSLNYMGFNMLDPVVGGLSERARKLRQALSIAIDYDEFISIFLNGRGLPGQGPLPPGIFGYRDGLAGMNPVVFRADCGNPPLEKGGRGDLATLAGTQPAQKSPPTPLLQRGESPGLANCNRFKRRPLEDAKKLLAEAGYPNGRDAVTGQPLTLYFDTPASGPEAKSRMDWFRKQFAKLDIQLVIRATDYNRFQDKMGKGGAQLFEWGWNADYPDPENFLFLLYGPNRKVGVGGENAANYQNPEFDRLFERMKDMDNGPERQAVIDAMVKLAREDAPWVFAFHPKSFGLRHSWVKNAKPNLMTHNLLKYRRVDPAARAAYQTKWNQPARWPLLLAVAVLLALIWPAVAGYRRRLRATA